ncbi:MAG: Crp/Fnr family transcriptional regulator [Deltaproteobacteria bacterium]
MKKLYKRQEFKSCTTCGSRADSIFCDLNQSGLQELETIQQKLKYPGGTILFLEGERPRGVYCVCSGRIKLSIHAADGRAVTVGYASNGYIVGTRAVLSGNPHDITARTVEESQLSFMDRERFLSFLKRRGEVSFRLSEALGDELSESYEDIKNIALGSSYERLVSVLLRLCDKFGEPSSEGILIKLNLSQEELAEMACMSRRTLSRAVQRLKKVRIIKCDRRVMIIRDRNSLAKLLS